MYTNSSYLQKVWAVRFFWWHLALSDIRARFRRSYLGIIWAILNPLLLTALLTLVMSFVFKSQPLSYATYVFSGLVVWTVITDAGNCGCDTFIRAESYIKQFKHPMLIYPLRTVIVSLIYMLYGFIGLLVWIAIRHPMHLLEAGIWLIPGVTMLLLVALPVSILCGVTNTKFRDFSQMLTLIFQAIWYASPIFISADVLLKSKHLYVLVDYNPVYHLLELFRAPMLYGHAPSGVDFLYVAGTALVLWGWAVRLLVKNEKMMIHYL